MTFYDSVSGKPLFAAPKVRSMQQFKDCMIENGWPIFHEDEVQLGLIIVHRSLVMKYLRFMQLIWENIDLIDGEILVSKDGTYLGRRLNDSRWNNFKSRWNISSIAGRPISKV